MQKVQMTLGSENTCSSCNRQLYCHCYTTVKSSILPCTGMIIADIPTVVISRTI
ncbi:hypothetical protein [Methanomethylovorans sp.]|uniref:hypothetical protein n=1 Tax=Methanomethylovorans sp. TaxID=2758717 RepID=UPI003C74548D